MLETVIVIAVIVLIISFASFYLIRAKKNGAKCIGCPAGGSCHSKSSKNSSQCCCCSQNTKDTDNKAN